MISQPIATISKFSGMNDNGGTFYIDGFAIENENGVMSLDEAYRVIEEIKSGDDEFTNLSSIQAISYIQPLSGSTFTLGYPFRLLMDNTSKFYISHYTGSYFTGEFAGLTSGGGYLNSQRPDIFELNSGNIIYTSAYHLGLMIRGRCKTGSGTTKIIDTDGRNLETLGASTSSPNNIVSNLKTGEQYTITSITDEDATKDALNFNAGVENSTNDEFVILVNTFKTLATTTQFKGQLSNNQWARPIRQWGDQYLIGNGNYLALLANDEDTFDATYKQLPAGYQLLAFEVGGSDEILVSAYDKKGQSYLLLWDGFSDGWNEIKRITTAPQGLKPYRSGWVYLSDSVIYFTDGRTIEKLVSHPEKDYSNKINISNHNGILIDGDKMFFAISTSNISRQMPGVLVFDTNYGLCYFKCKQNGKAFTPARCIYINNNVSVSSSFSTANRDVEIGCDYSLNILSTTPNSTSTSDFKSVIFYLDFKQEQQIREVWINLKRSLRRFFSNRDDDNLDISVNYGNGDYPVIKYGQMGTGTTTTINNPNGVSYPGVVGEEIEFVGQNEISGQRTFITSIANPGTVNEVWTISPTVSTTSTGTSDIRVWGVKNGETKSITLDDLSKPVRFNTNFLGSKMWLEVVVRGKADSFPVSIENIQLF